MTSALDLTIKRLTGHTDRIQILRNATVLQLKQLVSSRIPNVPVHRVKLIANYSGPGGSTVLDDDTKTLSSYSSVTSGITLFLIVQSPFKIYVQDPNSKIFEIEIPDGNPETYAMTDLRALVEKITGLSLDDYQFQFKGKPLDESNHGKKCTLKDHSINKEDTVFLMKLGFVLNITQPMVDLCFMVDCTGSMGSWIESVKNNVKQIRDQLETQYKGCDLQFSFVRYTDYDQPESTRTTWLNFTKSLSAFHSFVNPIVANGGGDGPEDIMGALKVTLSKLSWRSSAAKTLIHIADAPCHGRQYHDTEDDHPNGDPARITHEQMMSEVARLEIQYWFGYIQKDSTDKMISVFNDSLKQQSNHTLLIRQFEAIQPEQIGNAVHKSVTASVTATEAKKASARTFDSSAVNWVSISEKRATKTPLVGVKTLQDLQGGLNLSLPSVSFTLKIAPNPFSDGEESIVYKGLDASGNSQVILKQLKAADSGYERYSKVQEVQVVASTYAHGFNTDVNKPSHLQAVEFIKVDLVNISGTYYILQEFVDGKFEKYNTNNGIVCMNSSQSDMMQAFSHFTYVQSGGSLLICDLEGVQKRNSVLLTDPAIHNRMCPKKYGPTDTGFLGIKRFFNSHECKSICHSMGLNHCKP